MCDPMSNPETVLGKVDAAKDFIKQMHVSHDIRDEENFKHGYNESIRLLFEATQQADDSDSAEMFLIKKGILQNGNSKWIVTFEDGREFDIAELLTEFKDQIS